MGASMVKWIAHDPCLVLSDSDSKLYTNFEFCKERNRNLKNKHVELKNQAIYVDKKIPRKVYIFWKMPQVVCK